MRKFVIVALALSALSIAGAASALVIAPGTYVLHNHPDGFVRPPLYGLRLDGLTDGNSATTVTFDFEAPGAGVHLTYDDVAGTVRIFGTVFGGVDTGSSYASPVFADIDFLYTGVTGTSQLVSNSGSGSITLAGGSPIQLVSSSSGAQPRFELLTGHRGFAGVSGRGWLNHETGGLGRHLFASDWLFTVGNPRDVPEPSLALLLGGSGLLLSSARRRRSLLSIPGPGPTGQLAGRDRSL